jgi:hypothetical protein
VYGLHDASDRLVRKLASENVKFCDFSPEIKSTQFRGTITEAHDENPVSEPSMTKDPKKSTQKGSTVAAVCMI